MLDNIKFGLNRLAVIVYFLAATISGIAFWLSFLVSASILKTYEILWLKAMTNCIIDIKLFGFRLSNVADDV